MVLDRETNRSLRGWTIWLTGLPSAGKTTLGQSVARRLLKEGETLELLDGDLIRSKISPELGFSRKDRESNLRRISFIADLLARNGITVVVAAISPYSSLRSEIRDQLSPFIEVFINAPLSICEQRDVKGLYRRYRSGEIKGLTGVDDVYEPPLSPDVECRTDLESVDESAEKIVSVIRVRRERDLVDDDCVLTALAVAGRQ
jgi:adenylylsulfate kinase